MIEEASFEHLGKKLSLSEANLRRSRTPMEDQGGTLTEALRRTI